LGLYVSSQRAQYSFTGFTLGQSESPMGKSGWLWQSTRGHLPKSDFLYFSSYERC
jgi:hypothetical protein